jgi:hypothetical protein
VVYCDLQTRVSVVLIPHLEERGLFVRVNRQQFTQDALQTLVENVNKVIVGVTSLTDAAEQLLKYTRNVPGINSQIQDLIASMRTTTTQVAEANNAISATRSNLPVTGWISDWPLPQRLRPNPDIYAPMSPDPPLTLRDTEPPLAGQDKGAKR